jgi:hypothetical protein
LVLPGLSFLQLAITSMQSHTDNKAVINLFINI